MSSFFFSSRRRHTRCSRDWSSDVCSSDLYHVSADLTGQANHLGVTIEADIIKQKLPENNGGYAALNIGDSSYGKFDKRIYTDLCSDHPIDLTRYQVANCYIFSSRRRHTRCSRDWSSDVCSSD